MPTVFDFAKQKYSTPDFANRRESTEFLRIACTEFVASFLEYVRSLVQGSMFDEDDEGDEDDEDAGQDDDAAAKGKGRGISDNVVSGKEQASKAAPVVPKEGAAAEGTGESDGEEAEGEDDSDVEPDPSGAVPLRQLLLALWQKYKHNTLFLEAVRQKAKAHFSVEERT